MENKVKHNKIVIRANRKLKSIGWIILKGMQDWNVS